MQRCALFALLCRPSAALLDESGGRRLGFRVDHAALQKLLMHRLGRTPLITNRCDWTAEQVVAAYAGQQAIEQVFRGLKEGDWLNWRPLYHWTDSKIRVHAFYCLLGLSTALRPPPSPGLLALDCHRRAADRVRANPTVRTLVSRPGRGSSSHRHPVSTQSLMQKGLAETLDLQQFGSTPRG
jgi:hypothetical protein